MSHTLTADAGLGNLNTASVADNTFVSDFLVFTAVTFPVLGRPENTFTEQAVSFRLQRSVIDGFGLLYLTSGPVPDLFRRSQADFDGIERHRLIYFIFCSCFRHCALLPKLFRMNGPALRRPFIFHTDADYSSISSKFSSISNSRSSSGSSSSAVTSSPLLSSNS